MQTRRTFLASGVALLGCAAERAANAPVAEHPAASPAPEKKREPRSIEVLDWTFPNEFGGPKRATVLVPRPIAPNERLPVLIALHGLGETVDPVTGANAWPKSYALTQAYERLLAPPLEPVDLQGLVTSERLTELNENLTARELGGVIVVCPYMPKDIGGAMPIELYAEWLGKRVLPRVRSELPTIEDARATGIDGVSLGGWAAIRIGMTRPDLFGVVGALQPAIVDPPMIEWATQLLAQKLGGRPFRFVTSTEDLYRYTLTELDKRLTAKGVPHEFLLTPGPHDYPWNKGPGSIEMLLWHDRKLRA